MEPADFDASLENLSDRERLLPGEDPGSTELSDAEHWRSVYSQLLGFKDALLRTVDAARTAVDPAAEHEVAHDTTILTHERERLRRRYEFWQRRYESLRSRD